MVYRAGVGGYRTESYSS